jgi:hypothetical protein
LNSRHERTNGIVPDSGKAFTTESRDESKAVSTPW